VLGAGGAARAAVWSLQRQGLGVAVSARRPEAAAMLAAEFGVEATRWPPSQAWTLIVNATPVGTWPDVEALPIPLTSLRAPFVYDLVYNPVRTALLTAASAAGAETIGGLSMLVHQARRQAEWWTGLELPHDVFESAARECVVTGPDDRLGGARPHPGISA
jgi:shikimate 5-dehydrogenase